MLANLAETETLKNYLETQVNDLNLKELQQEIAMLLIQSLEESGLMQLNVEELEELFNHRINIDQILGVLINVVQHLTSIN